MHSPEAPSSRRAIGGSGRGRVGRGWARRMEGGEGEKEGKGRKAAPPRPVFPRVLVYAAKCAQGGERSLQRLGAGRRARGDEVAHGASVCAHWARRVRTGTRRRNRSRWAHALGAEALGPSAHREGGRRELIVDMEFVEHGGNGNKSANVSSGERLKT